MADWSGMIDLDPGQVARLRGVVRPVNAGVGLVVVTLTNPAFAIQWTDASGSFRSDPVEDMPDWVMGIETTATETGTAFALKLASDQGGPMLATIHSGGCILEAASLAAVG